MKLAQRFANEPTDTIACDGISQLLADDDAKTAIGALIARITQRHPWMTLPLPLLAQPVKV